MMRVGLQDMHTGIPLPGLITTTVINFSPQGACLVLPKLTINGNHLFYETLNSDSYNLLLYPEGRDGFDEELMIAARSIWMDTCEHMDKPAFKIGIHFLHDQKELYKLLKQSSGS
ncbi:MAG: hypothetical protein GQ542_09120 [Desulforhopalus sp.]|nr:hypothetical protein [Desulforhopalus sp.]